MRMRLMISTLILAGTMGTAAMAQDATTFTSDSHPHLSKAEWEKLTPEQRAAKRAERRAKWEAMTPEQRAAKKAEHKAKWDAMTPEQQAKVKAERKARFDSLPAEEQAKIKAERKAWRETHAENRDKLLPSEEKTNRGHLRRGAGISRPAGVDAVDTNH